MHSFLKGMSGGKNMTGARGDEALRAAERGWLRKGLGDRAENTGLCTDQ